jgi:carbonic anhydrase/acetyltransferase-like protein (isoleucine patch superfamily)
MDPRIGVRSRSRRIVLAVAGAGAFAAGVALGGAWSRAPRIDAAPTPPVGAGNQWGQHAPHGAKDAKRAAVPQAYVQGGLRGNVAADFNPDLESPSVHASAWIDPMASVIGHVELGERVYVAPFASIRGDEGQPIRVGNESNLQDGVVIHALETFAHGEPRWENSYLIDGMRYAVYIGSRVSLAHQSQVHGPAWIEDNVFVGMQALVFKAHVGAGSVIEPAAKVIGVTVPPGRYVPAGMVVTSDAQAEALPPVTYSYAFRDLNDAVVHVNTSLADGYSGRARP